MLHLEAPESRTCSGFPHPVAQSAPNKLGTPHGQGFSDSLLVQHKRWAAVLELKFLHVGVGKEYLRELIMALG